MTATLGISSQLAVSDSLSQSCGWFECRNRKNEFVRILRILFSLRQKKYGIEGEGILFTDFFTDLGVLCLWILYGFREKAFRILYGFFTDLGRKAYGFFTGFREKGLRIFYGFFTDL